MGTLSKLTTLLNPSDRPVRDFLKDLSQKSFGVL